MDKVTQKIFNDLHARAKTGVLLGFDGAPSLADLVVVILANQIRMEDKIDKLIEEREKEL